MALLDREVDQLLQEFKLPFGKKKPAARHTKRETVHRGERKFSTHYHHLGPGGRPRNVGVMSKEKLQHLAAHPDSTDELRRMTRAELRRRGHHVPRISESQYIEAWSPMVEAGSTHHLAMARVHMLHANRAKLAGDHKLHLVHKLMAAEHERVARDTAKWHSLGLSEAERPRMHEGLLVAMGRPTYPDSPEWEFRDEDLDGELQVREAARRGRTLAELHGMMPLNRPSRAGRWHPDEDVDPRAWTKKQLEDGWKHHSHRAIVHARAAKHFADQKQLADRHDQRARHHRRRAANIHAEYFARTGRGVEAITGAGGELFHESRTRRTLERAFRD
jgi:hypothetical protein